MRVAGRPTPDLRRMEREVPAAAHTATAEARADAAGANLSRMPEQGRIDGIYNEAAHLRHADTGEEQMVGGKEVRREEPRPEQAKGRKLTQ